MRESKCWLNKCMDLGKRGLLYSSFIVVLVLLITVTLKVEGQTDDALTFNFLERPPSVTSNTTAAFRWDVVAPNGSDPCATVECVNQCKLDDAPFQNCSSRYAVYLNLTDGIHVFTVLVSTLRGHFYPNDTTWTVDTTPPTATFIAASSFTNTVNYSVGIRFSELCLPPPNGGLLCPNISSCFVYVNGAGVVLPSSLAIQTDGLEYSITVALSSASISGRAQLGIKKSICSDAAGNLFVRSSSSNLIVRFDRTTPTVNMWTPVQDSQVQIGDEYKTISATNSSADLIIYLDFSMAMVTLPAQFASLLQTSHGIISSIPRKPRYRKFAFMISNISNFAIVSVTLPANSSFNRFGTPVIQTTNVTFLYDSIRPQVTLSTTSLAKSKHHYIPFLIQFTEPVFVFGATNVTVTGGNLTRFEEVSKSTYTLELYISDDDVASVGVRENATYDIAGNPNLPSNVLQVRHYTEPAFAVALYSFTTAGLIATALASGAISISSATLAAAGALGSRTSGSFSADPSRNLLGMATHLQVFALSDWLAVSLPVEYRETIRGLRWLIPHVNPPWQKQRNSTSLNNPLLQQLVQTTTPMMKPSVQARRGLLGEDDHGFKYIGLTHRDASEPDMHLNRQPPLASSCFLKARLLSLRALQWIHPRSTGISHFNLSYVRRKYGSPFSGGHQGAIQLDDVHYPGRRRLGPNMTFYGPALGSNEYALYFENDTSNIELQQLFHQSSYTGWRDFARNMFWVGAVGGGLILLHILFLLLLRWRTRTSIRGALTIPRFELFLLILAIPCICQASAFIIRGGTTLGIIIGVLLLAIPAAFLLSAVVFLIIAVYMGSLVQYTEVFLQAGEDKVRPWRTKLVEALAVPSVVAKWVRKDGIAPTFVPRYGLFFEDRKGPPKLIQLDGEVGGSFPKWIDSGSNGVGRMRAVNSDDESDEVPVPMIKKFLGGVRAAYIVVDISRRIGLGVIFGAFPRSDKAWVQVFLALGFTIAQLLYLILFKPFIKRGVQIVETISLLCETGLFITALVLLVLGHPADDHLGLGILMLALLLLSFVSQLVNEWYALMKQLLRLSPSQEPSLKVGLKMLGRGLVLPFIPRGHWGRFVTPQPPQPGAGLVPVVHLSPEHAEVDQPEVERPRRSTSVHTGSPLMAIGPEPAVPGYDPGSPAFIDPRNGVTEEAVISGEIKPDPFTAAPATAVSTQRQDNTNKPNTTWSSQWSRSRSMEGKRSKRGTKSDPKSSEMKMLRDIAKASFPRWRKHEEFEASDPGLEISSPVPSNLGSGAVARRHSSSAPSRVGATEEHGYSDDNTGSDNSSDDERYGRRPQVVGESSVDVLGGPSRGITPHSSSSFEKGSKGSGPLEATLSGGSLPIRELVQER